MAAFGSNWYQMHRWVLAWRWHMVGFGSNCYHIHTISSRTRCRGAATLPACSLLRLARKVQKKVVVVPGVFRLRVELE